MQTEQYRGPITNRGLTTAFNIRDGCPTMGNLDLLGLSLSELRGKKILDVGMGGGRTLKHALELDLDCHGLDILPLIDTSCLEPAKKDVVAEQLSAYEDVSRQYPSRVKAVNFCSTTIPYAYNEFDIVFSAVALPDYARNMQEAEQAILNMICLAKEQIVFHCGWNPDINYLGYVTLGVVPRLFQFQMKKFMDDLVSKTGIQYRLQPSNPKEANPLTTNINIDAKNKNYKALQTIYEEHMLSLLTSLTTLQIDEHQLSSSHLPLTTV